MDSRTVNDLFCYTHHKNVVKWQNKKSVPFSSASLTQEVAVSQSLLFPSIQSEQG